MSPQVFLNAECVATLKGSNELVLLPVNKSRGRSTGLERVIVTRRVLQARKFNPIAARTNRSLRHAGRVKFNVDYFDQLVNKFILNKKFYSLEHREHMDLCLKINFKKLISPKKHIVNCARFMGRWPSKFYEKVYFINKKNKSMRDANSRFIFNKFIKEYSDINMYSVLHVDACEASTNISYCDKCRSWYQDSNEVDHYHTREEIRKIKTEEVWYEPQPFILIVPEVRERNPSLLAKLRTILNNFRLARLSKKTEPIMGIKYNKLNNKLNLIYNPIELAEEAYPQGDSAQGEINELTTNVAGNVILTETQQESVAIPLAPVFNWSNAVSSDIKGSYTEMTDRWIKFKDFIWTKNQGQNSTLFKLNLPRDAFSVGGFCNIPNFMPFKVHRYWRGDIEVKIQVNSNKFQMGQLQCGWFYEPDCDSKFDLRDHICAISQTDHVLISAGASNEATLVIPFKNHLAMLSTKSRSDISASRVLNMGTLICKVMNPLCVPTSGPSQCFGTLFIKFTNNTFTGQLHGKLDPPDMLGYNEEDAYPQMDTAISAVRMVNKVLDTFNADNPPNVSNPISIVPTASHSWANGTNISEPLQSLRLDPIGQVQHPDRCPDESSISSIVSKFGFVKTFDWASANSIGTLLYSCDAAPMLNKSSYMVNQGSNGSLDSYYIPPVGVVTSLFNYWRGCIKFRFDIIATQFHTGRLLVGYVPGATESSNVTMSTVLAGPHMVFTLHEDQQFCYEIPFICDRPFWFKKYMGNFSNDQVLAPSRLYIYVLNPLIPMQSVYDTVFVNVYMAAGESFEVSVPVQPSVGCGYNTQVLYSSSELIHAQDGYAPYYCGNWHGFGSSKYLCMRYGEVSEHYSIFETKFLINDTLNEATYYQFLDSNVAPTYINMKGGVDRCDYCVLIWFDESSKYACLIPCANEKSAQNACVQYQKDGKAPQNCFPYYILATYHSANRYSGGNPSLIVKKFKKTWRSENPFSESEEEEYAILQGEQNNVTSVISMYNGLSSTNSGFMLFGERFFSLKDFTRRYQNYCNIDIFPKDILHQNQCSYIIPILPQGLDLNLGTTSSIIEYMNRCRDGHIPVILSGYRYFRGSVRFRIIVPSVQNLIVWVQHKPDRKLRQLMPIRCSSVTTAEGISNYGYATYIQDTRVNSIIEFEVPFYQNSVFGFLQRPNQSMFSSQEAYYFSLGELSIGFISNSTEPAAKEKFSISIYYALGDDMQFSTFQGFPPMCLLDDITNVKLEEATPQGNEIEDVAEPQGLREWVREKIDRAKTEIKKDVSDEVTEVIKEVSGPALDTIISEMADLSATITSTSVTDVLNTSLFRTITGHIAQMAANFNWKSIMIGISAICVEIGILSIDLVTKFIDKLTIFFNSLKIRIINPNEPGIEPNPPDITEEVAAPQGESEDAAIGLITLIWTSICSLFALVKTPPKDIINLSKFLTVDMSQTLRSANQLFIFLKNILSVLEPMRLRIMGYISPAYKKALKLSDEYAHIKALVQEVTYLRDPRNFEAGKYTQEYKARINIAYTRAAMFFSDVHMISDPKISYIIKSTYQHAHEMREKMVDLGDDNFVRFEPFTMWQYGEAGVGKSTIMTDICMRLLGDMRIKTEVPPIYVHNVSSDHWDSCQNNPIMLVDDMFSIQEGPLYERYLATLFSVVSPIVLVPPKAHLEEKGKAYSNLRIFGINSNYAFPNFNNVDMSAVYRRRDILWKSVLIDFEKMPQFKKLGCMHCEMNWKPSECNATDLEDYHHLLFFIYKDASNPDSGTSIGYRYNEFYEILKVRCKNVIEKNKMLYEKRVKMVLDAIATIELDDSNLDEAFEIYQTRQLMEYRKMVDSSWVQSFCFETSELGLGVINRVNKIYNRCWDLCKTKSTCNNEIGLEPETSKISANPQGKSIDDAHKYGVYNHYRFMKALTEYIKSDNKYDDYSGKFPYPLNHVASLCDTVYEVNTDEESVSNETFSHLLLSVARSTFQDPDRKLPSTFASTIMNAIEMSRNVNMDILGWDVRCDHRLMDITQVVYDDKAEKLICPGWKIDNPNVFFDCNTNTNEAHQRCLMTNHIFVHMFCVNLLVLNPQWDFDIIPRVKSVALKVPEIFRFEKLINIPDEAEWREICKCAARQAWRKVVNFGSRAQAFLLSCVKWLPVILPVMGMLASCGVMWHMRDRKSLSTMEMDIVKQAMNNGWSMPQNQTYTQDHNNVNLNAKVPTYSPQAEIPQLEVAIKRVLDNFFTITALFDDKRYTCTGVCLRDRSVLVLRHFMEEMNVLPETTQFYGKFKEKITYPEGIHGVAFNFRECETSVYNVTTADGCYASNYVVLYLPSSFPQSKDITRFFANARDHSLHTGSGLMIQNNGRIVDNLNIIRENTRPIVIRSTENSSKVVLQDMYSYKLQGRGLCGSIICSRQLERPILGMHVAGIEAGNVRGLAEILTFETFNEIKRHPDLHYSDYILPELTDKEFAKIDINSIIYPFGCTDSRMSAHQGSETSLVPSLIQGTLPLQTEPNPLSSKDSRLPPNSSPLALGVAHMGKPPLDFLKSDLDDAKFDLKRVIIQNVKPIRQHVGVVDLDIAICGDKQIYGFEPIEWSTSPGYPLRFMKDFPSQSGKKWLFNLELQNDGFKLLGLHPKLEKQLVFDQSCRERGIKPFTVFIDCLKDTTLPISKCKIPGKTRVFSISPIQFTIQFRQYFLDFMAAHQKARFSAEHGIGMDVTSLEWTDLVSNLQSRGDKIICGDYKNFGPGLMLKAAHAAFEIILDWYEHHGDGENNKIRKIMICEVLGAYHLCTNLIYSTPCGIPSGSPITTPLNSLVGSLYMRVMWKRITNLSFREMHEHCWMITYGDDVCINISDKICDIFNTETIGIEFSKYNIVFTDADKTENVIKYRSILDSSFLKNKFMPHPNRSGVWLAALDKVSVEGCSNWINKQNDKFKATKQNVEQAIMLAHGWGEEYYKSICTTLEKACIEHDISIFYDSWSELDRKRYSN